MCVCIHLCLVHMEMFSFNAAARHPNTLVFAPTCRYHFYAPFLFSSLPLLSLSPV